MSMTANGDTGARADDQAARAAWLSYVGGLTQDQIAREMGLSRQRVQRLVARAVAEGLIHVRLDHRMARAMELEAALRRRLGLQFARVAPSLGAGGDPVAAIAPLAAAEIESVLASPEPRVIAVGTGRAMRAAVEEIAAMDCPQHRIVSLIGNIAPDGSASFFDVVMRLADKVRARHYPMPLPVVTESPEELRLLTSVAPVARSRALAAEADHVFVGVGQTSDHAPILEDGFVNRNELAMMREAGAVGEIVGWAYDSQGRYLDIDRNRRVGGVRLEPGAERQTTAVAAGPDKLDAIRAAIAGRLVNGLITDEKTAEALLGER